MEEYRNYTSHPMLTSRSFLALFTALFALAWQPAGAVIPQPGHVEQQQGALELKPLPIACASEELTREARYLQDMLLSVGLSEGLSSGAKLDRGILLRLNKSLKTPESYVLTVTGKGVAIEGSDRAGVFYGIQTLMQQIAKARHDKTGSLPCTVIRDEPRYAWRGFMLDEARHFFGMQKVKQILDLMAYYKLNKFHWHLTDEQGWRIEIKQYPKLTTIGGKGSWSRPNDENARYYTTAQIQEIVRYAAERHIEIIPEIDMPGHATAANRAYPQYSGGGTKDHPEYTFNPGKKEVYPYLTNILKEVAALFPSHILHLGGDEVAFGSEAWKTDPDVQKLMKKEGLKNIKEVEIHFNRKMAGVVKTMGKTLMGWDELLDCDLDPKDTIIMWWRHDRPNMLKKSLDKGYRTILCPRRPLYFDFVQAGNHKWGRTWNGFCPLEDVYAFPDSDLAKLNLPAGQMPLILGIQANLWTERVQNEKRLDFMVFPRLCALAESAWSSPEVKNFEGFTARMEEAYRLFDSLGLYYYDARNPEKHPEPAAADKGSEKVPLDFRD